MQAAKNKQIEWIRIIAIGMTLFGIVLRWVYILAGRFPFNSDEAVVGLMARHILSGERPIFFYGQAYMGSLDAWLNAISFKLIGESIISMRVTQTVLWIVLLVSVFFLAREVFSSNKAGWIAVIILANPVVNVFLYTTSSLGGYNEALIIGVWSLIIALQIIKENQGPNRRYQFLYFAMGFCLGFGLWVFAFALVFTIPAMFSTFWDINRKGIKIHDSVVLIIYLILGFIIGSLPWLIHGIQNGLDALLIELTGSAVAVEGGSWLARASSHFVNFLLLGVSVILGFRAPWSVSWIILLAIPFILFAWVWILKHLKSVEFDVVGKNLIWIVVGFNIICFVGLSFGIDPSGRYFLPISILLSILAAGGLLGIFEKSKRWGVVFASILVVYAISGTIISNWQSKSGFTTQFAPNTEPDHENMDKLISFLHKKSISRGYTNYWVSYPLAFLSQEELIFSPRLPYHKDFRYTSRDNRYNPYNQIVSESNEIAYIVDQFPELTERIREGLKTNQIKWNEEKIGGFDLIYGLSKPITPEELNLTIVSQAGK